MDSCADPRCEVYATPSEGVPAIAARFSRALEFITAFGECARGPGVFVRGAPTAPVGAVVDVDVELPGYARFRRRGRVFEPTDRKAAASATPRGLYVELPCFCGRLDRIIDEYRRRIWRRRDAVVVSNDRLLRALLERAGCDVQPPPPDQEADEAPFVEVHARSEPGATAGAHHLLARPFRLGSHPLLTEVRAFDEFLRALDAHLLQAERLASDNGERREAG